MPLFNLTITDSSPLIEYSNGIWQDSPHSDQLWDDYANGTFHTTQDNGATATLMFNGSAVYVVGARRPEYGQYLVTLDSHSTIGNASSTSPVFNSTIFSQTGLDNSQHQLVLTNRWTSSTSTGFDISYMIITSGDGNSQTSSMDVIMDDSALNISYSPGWDSSPNGFQSYYFMQTMHRTDMQGASASVLFYGNAITVYGATSSNHGIFTISMDGVPIPAALNGSAPENLTRWQNMLYYSGGLSTTLHNMTIANVDPTAGMFLDLDKVVVSTWPDFDVTSQFGTSSYGPNPTTPSVAHSPNTNQSRIAYIVAGAIVAATIVALVGLVTFCILRRLRRRNIDRKKPDPIEDDRENRSEAAIIEPFPLENVHERSPPSPSQTLETSTTSLESSYVARNSPLQTVHSDGDFPPPNYEEATASLVESRQRLPSVSRPDRPLS